jgi:hypothetical protein
LNEAHASVVVNVEYHHHMEEATRTCPLCHRVAATHRVVIGRFERTVCRQCADSYKRTPGVVIEALR